MHKRIRTPASERLDMVGLKVKRKRKARSQDPTDEKDRKKAVCHKDDSAVTTESDLLSMKSTLTKAKESLMEKLVAMKTDIEKKTSKLNQVTHSCKQIESDIKSESQRLRDVIDLQEKKLLGVLESVADKEIGQLKTDIKKKETPIQTHQQHSEVTDHAVKSDCEMETCETDQSCDSGVTESADDTNIGQKNKRTVDRISLKSYTDHLIKALNEMDLGDIEVRYEDRLDRNATLELQKNICVRIESDKWQHGAEDVTVMYVNGTEAIVVTDTANNCVKSFYIRNKEPCHSRLYLGTKPHKLTQLKHNQVAVTVPGNKQIVILEVNPDLKLISTITTSKEYWGITALTQSTIAVTALTYHCVDIMDITGTVIRSITPTVGNENILKYPSCLCTTKKGNILLCGKNTVLCLTPQGDVVFNNSPTGDTKLKDIRAITVTSAGDILMADDALHNVLQLTETGQFVRNILTSQDELLRPNGLCIDRRGQLYVSMFSDVNIKVFSAKVSDC